MSGPSGETSGRVIALDMLPSTELGGGDAIGPITRDDEFAIVERGLVRTVFAEEVAFFRREVPLATVLHPKTRKGRGAFLGYLANGFVTVQSETDMDLLGRVRSRGKSQADTLSAIVEAELHTSAGLAGTVLRQVIYFKKTTPEGGQRVGRFLVSTNKFGHDGSKDVERQSQISAAKARDERRHSILYPYQAGAPGSKPRAQRTGWKRKRRP